MGLDKIKKSNRLLQSRRYTQESLNDNQEAFTRVLDLNATEIYIDQGLIPYDNLPFSGSSQSGSIFTSGSKNIAKYYYRHPLTPATTGSSLVDVWLFLNPTRSLALSPQEITGSQQTNFISPKYSNPSLTLNETEATSPTLPGYNVVVYTGSLAQIYGGTGFKVSGELYQFDYKTGILQFNSSVPDISGGHTVAITAYQYLGDTLDKFISSSNSGGGTGAGFPFSGSAVITGSLTVSGSSGITLVGGGTLIGTASWATNATNATSASYATNAQNILPTLFEIPELNLTGSGIIISSSNLGGSTYNALRIGNTELVDAGSVFITNIGGVNGWTFSGSAGIITDLTKNIFNFYEAGANYNFRSNATNFTVYKSQSATNDATIAFDVNRQTGLLYASGGASISGSANIQNNLTVGGALSTAGASTLDSLTVTNDATITGNLTVNGTTTYINVDNLLVEDKFILLNSGSKGGVPNEGGIIVQTGTGSGGEAIGTALYYDQEANRWVVNRSSSVAWNVTSSVLSTSSDFIVTVTASAGIPTGTPVNFGTTNYYYGQMYVQTDTSDIYIYA